MRFRQGSIEISPVHDEPILRLVLRAGYLSHEQMLRFMRLGVDSFLRHSLNWRLRRRFVYIAANYHLLNCIARMFDGTKRPVYFGLVTDILQRQLDMDVLDASRTHRQRLWDALLRWRRFACTLALYWPSFGLSARQQDFSMQASRA